MVGKPESAEMHAGPGFRYRSDIDRPDPRTVEGLGEFDTPAISDLVNRLHTIVPTIHNVSERSPSSNRASGQLIPTVA
jgi:hypothetical protein